MSSRGLILSVIEGFGLVAGIAFANHAHMWIGLAFAIVAGVLLYTDGRCGWSLR